jgi:DNA-directed RNA polymerase subunit beta'
LATALPGFLTKEIAGNMGSVRISEQDCGTLAGIMVDVTAPAGVRNHDADLLDRHLAENVGRFKRNDTVTPQVLAELRDKKVSQIKVRSAMTCTSSRPPCSMCAGRRPNGDLHPVGGFIGYDYGMSTGERSTQLIMKKFHSGGTVGSGDGLSQGFARLRELLSAPETVKHQGTLADHDGTVETIRLAPQGGYFVVVKPSKLGETEPEHYIAAGRTLKVKVNDHVKRGDAISDGSYRPQEIADKRSSLAAQQYVVDEARKSFQQAGATVRKPVLEVVVAGTMRWMEVTDDGGEPDLAAGDLIHENDYAVRHAKNSRIQARPTVPGLSSLPIKRSTDLLERLNFQRLTDAMTEAPSVGAKSDLKGRSSPLPGLAYGALFDPIHHGDSAFNRGADH